MTTVDDRITKHVWVSQLESRHPPAICTIVAPNYLAHARCLTQSFLAHHPNGRAFALVVDSDLPGIDPRGESFVPVPVSQLRIRDFDHMTFRYDVTEFCTAVKPYFLDYLFNRFRLERLVYFDPDVYLYQPIDTIWSALESANVVLIPHLVAPVEDEEFGTERRILPVGVYNLGFIGLARSGQLSPLLQWWQRRLREYCLADVPRGLFVDQRWADLIPAFFDNVRVLREPQFNVAYWNIAFRKLTFNQGRWLVDGRPLVFYHFSGLTIRDNSVLSRHFQTAMPEGSPNLAKLTDEYRRRIFANGFESVEGLAYSYGAFDNGVPIPRVARHLWRNLEGEKYWPEPFKTAGTKSFFNWLNHDETAAADSASPLTNLALEIYRLHPELHRAWPDPFVRDREAFLRWFADHGAPQHQIDSAFVGAVRRMTSEASRAAGLQQGVTEARTQLDESSDGASPTIANALRRMGLSSVARRLLGKRLMYLLYDKKVAVRHPLIPTPMNRYDDH